MMTLEEADERGIGCYRGMVIVLPWLVGGYIVAGLIAWAFWPT